MITPSCCWIIRTMFQARVLRWPVTLSHSELPHSPHWLAPLHAGFCKLLIQGRRTSNPRHVATCGPQSQGTGHAPATAAQPAHADQREPVRQGNERQERISAGERHHRSLEDNKHQPARQPDPQRATRPRPARARARARARASSLPASAKVLLPVVLGVPCARDRIRWRCANSGAPSTSCVSASARAGCHPPTWWRWMPLRAKSMACEWGPPFGADAHGPAGLADPARAPPPGRDSAIALFRHLSIFGILN